MANTKAVTDSTFAAEVIRREGLTLVDFWAPWCAPCRAVAPVLEQIAQDYVGRVEVVKLDVDHSPTTAAQYRIRSIPAILLFKDGEPVDGVVGAVPRAQLAWMIDSHLETGVSG
jgi:thioredoxin 1